MGRSLRSWDKGAEWCCSTPLPRCRRRSPPLTPTPQCGEPGEPGTRGRRASQRKPPWDRGGRARPSAPPNPGRLSPTIPAAENRSSPVEGAAAGLGSGGQAGPRLSRAAGWQSARPPAPVSGAEFVTHLKVARNQILPNPSAQARGAGAMKPSEGRDEVRETKGPSLKAAMRGALRRWGRRSTSLPDLKGRQVDR